LVSAKTLYCPQKDFQSLIICYIELSFSKGIIYFFNLLLGSYQSTFISYLP
jgi:hypothetical protein